MLKIFTGHIRTQIDYFEYAHITGKTDILKKKRNVTML